MKNFVKGLLICAVLAVVVLLPISCSVWKYKECKKVGHSTLYCVLRGNR